MFLKNSVLKLYLKLFNFIARRRLEKKDLPERIIHAHLVSVLTTGVLMWAYAILAYLTISHPLPGIVGIIASLVHLLTPLLYLKNNNYFLNSNIFIGAGILHQMTFSYFTGGFDSTVLIWLGILPMLSGVIAGRKGAINWALITTSSILVFLILKLNGFVFPNLISEQGLMWSQGLILFGWVFIATIVIWVHVLLVEKNASMLELSRQSTQNVVNILSHDISTPLSVILVKLRYLQQSDLDQNEKNAADKAYQASERLWQITESIKELRLNELGKRDITLIDINVRELLLELKDMFSEKLMQKNIRLNWSVAPELESFSSCRSLILNQILGNLLSNAIKFSPKNNEIRLRVSKVGNSIKFLLEDGGVGIPQEMREHLFDASFSRSLQGTEKEVGTGFGLPIVKGCVDRLGGQVSFETKTSDEGPSGTRFTLLFPAHLSDDLFT